jgi:hypothetical protein
VPNGPHLSVLLAGVLELIRRAEGLAERALDRSLIAEAMMVAIDGTNLRAHISDEPRRALNQPDRFAIERRLVELGIRLTHLEDWRQTHGLLAKFADG